MVVMTHQPNAAAPDKRTRHGIAQVAGARSHGWSLIADLLSPPGPELVTRLRNAELVSELRLATDWLGEDAGRFLNVFMALDTFARRAARREPEQDLQAIADEYHRLFPGGPPEEVTRLREMASLCDQEAEAWADGDHSLGKELRLRENRMLEDTMLEHLPGWCATLDERTQLMLYRSTARLLTSYLSVESGRDFDRLVFGDDSRLSLDS